jgi:hypothetical protein
LPEIHNVPNYTGVRIHPGNTDADTEGCILVGKTKGRDFIGNSRAAFDKLFVRIQGAAQREKIFIEVTSAAPATRGLRAAGPRSNALAPVSPAPARLALVKQAGGRRPAAKRTATPKKRAVVRKPAAAKRPASAQRPASAKRRVARGPVKRGKKTKIIRRR